MTPSSPDGSHIYILVLEPAFFVLRGESMHGAVRGPSDARGLEETLGSHLVMGGVE